MLAQRLVGAHDVHELDRQVVLAPPSGALHPDRRAHLGRRHRQHREDHPVRPGVLRVEPELRAILVADGLDYPVRALGSKLHLARLLLVRRLLPLSRDREPVPLHVRLALRAAPAVLLRLSNLHDASQPVRRVLLLERVHQLALHLIGALEVVDRLVTEDDRTREADTPQGLEHVVKEGEVVHWLGELDVAKMAGALRLVHTARAALPLPVNGA
mmetsp:Transcript_78392/g.189230  ORF Transcript_78392/g.189230 Transcript_78392/m.189230 type:complete len:214 (+) Transcript_78392:3258-3899(+)